MVRWMISRQWLFTAATAFLLFCLYFSSHISLLSGLQPEIRSAQGGLSLHPSLAKEKGPASVWKPYSSLSAGEKERKLWNIRKLGCQGLHRTAALPWDPLTSLTNLCTDSYGQRELHAELAAGFEPNLYDASRGAGVIEEAFVSFIRGDSYALLVTNTIKAVHSFSSRPIVLFIAGELSSTPAELWPPAEHPQLVVYRMPVGTMHPWFDKLRAALLSPVIRGAIVESDTLPTMHADRLFKLIGQHSSWQPLLPVHSDLRISSSDCAKKQSPKPCGAPLPYPAQQRSIPYMHAHVMWNATARPFLASVLESCATDREAWVGQLDCSSDEHALNYALWNTKADKQLCLMDPVTGHLGSWEALDWSAGLSFWERLKVRLSLADDSHSPYPSDTACFLYLHSEKIPHIAQAVVQRLQAMQAHGKAAAFWCHGLGPQLADGSPRQRMWLKDERDIEESGRIDKCII